jgi:hypothetical protein
MNAVERLRFVVEPAIVRQGLSQDGGSAGLIIEAWLAGILRVFVTQELAYAYLEECLSANLPKWRHSLGGLLGAARFTLARYAWRPAKGITGDRRALDCAMNAGAVLVASSVERYLPARISLGLAVLTPVELVSLWAS